jgi:hypothetical protein
MTRDRYREIPQWSKTGIQIGGIGNLMDTSLLRHNQERRKSATATRKGAATFSRPHVFSTLPFLLLASSPIIALSKAAAPRNSFDAHLCLSYLCFSCRYLRLGCVSNANAQVSGSWYSKEAMAPIMFCTIKARNYP